MIPVGWLVLRPRSVVALAKRLAPRITGEVSVTRRHVLAWIGLYVLSWILGGWILYALICAMSPQAWTLLPVCVGLVATSGVLAILALPIPGGLGIREISLILLLQLYVQSPVAVAAGILLRLWLLLGEAFLAFLTFLAVRGGAWLAQTGHNTP